MPSRAGQAGPRALLAWWRGCDAFSPVLMGPSLQSAGAPQQQTFCYANCVAGDECVDYIVEAQVGNEVYLVIEVLAHVAWCHDL